MLWHKVIRSKYGMEEGGWWPCEARNTTYRSPWKAIQGLLAVFLDHAKLKLGNGDRIRFWEDAWGESVPFKTKYPNLFRLSLLHNKPVSRFLCSNSNQEPSWNLHFRRPVSERELEEVSNLLSSLGRVRVCGALEDKWVWVEEGSGLFTCKSLFKTLIDKPTFTPFNFYHFIWKISIPSKLRVFGWLLILKKLNTQDLLQKRQPLLYVSPSWCVMCKKGSETVNHLFLHCSVAQKVWTNILQKFTISWVLPQDINHLILGDFMFGRDRRTKLLWSLVIFAVLWTLWRERNQRIFEDREESLPNIIDSVHYWVALWASLNKDLNLFSFMDWLRGWYFVL